MMKHLIITGASGNLGRELIQFFDFEPYDKVYLVGKKDKFDTKLFDDKKFQLFTDVDFTNENSVDELFQIIKTSKEDYIFIIHLVGGYQGGKFLWEFTVQDLQKMIEKNLITSFLVSKYILLRAKDISGGSIIFISAKLSLDYNSQRSTYAISKNALNFLVKVIEKEAQNFNFTANAIAPYLIMTNENKKWVKEEDIKNFTTPEQIAKMIGSIFDNFQNFNGNIITTNDKF